MSVAIVTDSTADIPAAIVKRLKIRVIPAILIVQGKSYLDGVGITREAFYNMLPQLSKPPTTATPSIGAFRDLYQEIFAEGFNEIISIHVSETLSGMVNTARMAAAEFGERIRVIDSGQLSMGLGYQVIAAAAKAASNFGIEAVAETVQIVQKQIRLFAMLDTLEYIHRSGRVSWAKAKIGSLLRIKPFLEVLEGQVTNIGQVRTRKKGIKHLLDLIHDLGPIEKLAILHTNAEAEARILLSQVSTSVLEPPPIVNVTTVIGNHVGPNGLGFVAILKD